MTNLLTTHLYLSDWNNLNKGFYVKIDQSNMTVTVSSIDRVYGILGGGSILTAVDGSNTFFAYFSDRCATETTAPDYDNRLFCILGDKVYDAYCYKNSFGLKRNSLKTKVFRINNLSYIYYYPIWKNFFYPLVQDYGGLLKDDIVDSFYDIYNRNR